MKRTITIALLVVALAVAAGLGSTLAGDSIECTAPIQECLDKMVSNLSKMGWLGVMVEELREDGKMYLKITEVMPNSPAEGANFRPGDVLVAINGVALLERNKEEIYRTNKKKKRPGEYFTYTVLRGSRRIRKSVTLETMPYEAITMAVGAHMIQHSHVDISKLVEKEKKKRVKKK
jgi:C-terminal processing protease CtpA/Prc